MDLQLRDKAVLVTGGSLGIGREIALAFGREGARVAICARRLDRLDRTASEIRALRAECLVTAGDLSTASGCELAVRRATEAFGGIDILINNAGANVDKEPSKLVESSDDQLMVRVSGKALAAIRCSRAVLPHMAQAGWGRIVCIAGSSGRNVFRGRERSTSGGSPMVSGLGNAMIANFGKMLSEQGAKDGVLVNVIHPHITRSDRHAARMRARAAELGVSEEEAETDLAAHIPIGRVIEPSDIAPLVLFLASPINGAITGQTIAVDGGACSGIMY